MPVRRTATALAGASSLVLVVGVGAVVRAATDPCRDLSGLAPQEAPLAATADDYVGLAVADAVVLGKQRGVSLVRLTCRDRTPLVGTADRRLDRINIGVRRGVVVSAAVY